MKSQRYGIFLVLLIATFMLQACGSGGGSGNTDGSLVLSVSATSVAAGTPLSATATLSSTSGRPVNNLKVTYVSDAKDVIPDVTDSNGTSTGGVSAVTLATRNIKNTATTVHIYAIVGGIQSTSVQVTVSPATLTFAPPADATFAQTADATTKLCSAGIVRDVTSNAQVLFQNSSGQNVSGQPVAISVTSITNIYSGFDQVVFFPGGLDTVTIPPFTYSVTLTTDTNGIALLPVAIDGAAPTNKGGSHVFVVNWQATTSAVGDSGTTINYVVTKQTMITNSCN